MNITTKPWNGIMPSALLAALVFLTATASAQNGTWTNLVNGSASGSWSAATNWNNNIIASGADSTADFSTLDLTNTSTVTLDGAQTIGNVLFGDTDTNTAANWVLATGTAGPLNLAVSSGSPTITDNAGTSNTITAVLAGTSGLTVNGGGTLRLNTSNPNLSNLVVIASGVLQIGNAGAIGAPGNQNSNDRVICTNGGTLEIMNAVQPNNKHLTLAGTGVGGTHGALYASISSGSTRWGLSTLNDSGVSGNSSASFPAITLAGDTTIRIDGNWFTQPTAAFAIGHITGSNYTLTVAGGGRLSFDRGLDSITNLIVQGAYMPNQASAFGSILYYTVAPGGVILDNQNNCYSSSADMQMAAGSFWDINWRGNGTPGSDNNAYTQNIGYLNGAGTITSGSRGEIAAQNLIIQGSASNMVFNGTITVSNGIFNLTKNGTATLTLGGTNNYNGVTTINAGAWLVDGLHYAASNYLVNAGAVLGGSGAILQNAGNTITLNGALVAGDSGGTLTVSNVVGSGDVYVTNASLVVLGQLNSSSSGYYLNSLNLTNGVVTALLQQNGTEAAIYANNVNVDGTNNILSFTTANPVTGQFPFIKYSAIGGLNGFAGLHLQPPAGVTAYLSNNVNNSSIDIVITAIPALVWQGTPTADWTIGGSANWLNGVTPSAYTETAGVGPFVIFDDTAPGSTSVNVAANVTPQGITVASNNKNFTFAGTGQIGGTGSVVINGTSTLTVANDNALSGTITVANGGLALGNGGTSGSLGTASIANSGQVIFNRSDDVSFANAISGTGSLVKNNTDTVTLTGVGNIGGAIQANAGTLALGPAGTITVSGDVTGSGAFGINGAGQVILTSGNIAYTGGSLIAGGGTLEFDNAFPPSGNIADNGTLAFGVGGTFGNNVSGPGGLTLLNGAYVTLTGANTYAGPTTLLGSATLAADAANYPPASALILGSTNGAADVGSVVFTSGNPVLGGLVAGGNNASGDAITLAGSGQTLTVNGNVYVGNTPSGASVYLPVTGTGGSLTVNTNGGVIQIGLGTAGSGVNPDNVWVDFSGLDNFTANLGTNGVINLGTTDGNPGPPAGATVVNWFNLAAVSNSITAGTLNIGAGGRQLIPELRLGAGTNLLNVDTLALGPGGRDGGYLHFLNGTGSLRLRASDGVSGAVFNVGVDPATGTGAGITNTVDFTGHPVDLLVSTLLIGDYNNSGAYLNTFSFDTGTLDAQATSLSVLRNNNANAAISGSTLNIAGGTASLGPVTLTASAAYGTLNVANATLATANVSSPGTGASTLSIANSTWSLALTNNGNPVTPAVVAQNFSASGTVNLAVDGSRLTVGQFKLISYTGAIGGDGYPALNLTSLPAGVGGYLSNDVANLAVDLVITNAPVYVSLNPTNLTATLTGNQMILSWPADHTGWYLQAQTNALGAGLGANWVTISNTVSGDSFTNTIDPANGAVFYRLMYPQ